MLLPLLELAGIGHATYVVVYLVCVTYLMNPDSSLRADGIFPRSSTGIGLLVVYVLLLLAFLVTYMRLLQVTLTNPGFVPLGEPGWDKHSAPTKYFERYDSYICDYTGLPIFCEECRNFKPDRTHHDSHSGRCVRKLDHFCPWAGGVISETNFKFFIQLLFYGSLYTGYTLVVMAYFFTERSRKADSKPAHWVVALALAALFFLFAFGMFMTTFYNLSLNYTTIEIMQRGRIHHIAIRSKSRTSHPKAIAEISLSPSRTYFVVQTEDTDHPWDTGSLPNIQSVMGHTLWEWLLPLKMSPCTEHRSSTSEFPWSSSVRALRRV